eukprot:TRINITY_DN12494_c0_g1_i9.p1 TRINITY_DN12494_c0_g1~~TRINITY_DN12494_c0_g1_i9.p1  ORF type:complete len:538 (-),score=87.84 TRINITY_DN12494_c0_g1_i9:284-1897(-)
MGLPRSRQACWLWRMRLFSFGGFSARNPNKPTSQLFSLNVAKAQEAGQLQISGMSLSLNDPQSDDSASDTENTVNGVNSTGGYPATITSKSGPDADTPGGEVPRKRSDSQTSVRATKGPKSLWQVLAEVKPEHEVVMSPTVVVSRETDAADLEQRKVGIETLEEEGRKIKPANSTLLVNTDYIEQDATSGIAQFVLENLMKPKTWTPGPPDSFILAASEVKQLIAEVKPLLQKEDMVKRVRAPCKVFGDIHGQYPDLMRIFARYKQPTDGENGDIESMDYVFIGDFVDRGTTQLEVICCLYALKAKYPQHIHLLRGNHECEHVNSGYGFRKECADRLKEDTYAPDSTYNMFNDSFDWMAISAIIEDRIICLHGGIGGTIDTVDDLNNIPRPYAIPQTPKTAQEQLVTDVMWSDPTDNDSMTGITLNDSRDPDGSGRIVKFGPDRVNEFLSRNPPLQMIFRAHECVMDGFERFANGRLITIFSATDYCGCHRNAGAIIVVKRDLKLVPKLIYPQTRTTSSWDPKVIQQRPPTPCRGRK